VRQPPGGSDPRQKDWHQLAISNPSQIRTGPSDFTDGLRVVTTATAQRRADSGQPRGVFRATIR
jgi:hypothetical protein